MGGNQLKPGTKLFNSYLIFLVLYALFTLLPKPAAVTLLQYHVSELRYRIIELTVIITLGFIWYVALRGYAQLSAYADLIRTETDGKQVARLSRGVFLIALWLPVSNVLSSILNFIALHHPGFVSAANIIDNYVSLIIPLAGFVFVSLGAHGLSGIVRKHPTYRALNVLVLLIIYGGLGYYHLVITIPHRSLVYHLPVALILSTIVAPYLYMWYLGLKASYEISNYQRKIRGEVYKLAWQRLGFGLGWLIGTSVVFQYLTALTWHLLNLSIYWLLAIIYGLLLILALGFVFIGQGTKRLQRIEEV
jgi:hypothetical protein